MRMIFVNLPVSDLARSRAFYEGMGFSINPQFSDDEGACVVISDTIYLMILTRAKFEGFAPNPVADPRTTTGSLIALSCDSREEVVAMVNAALTNGGSDTGKVQDMEGFMYGRSICDPDGHVFEPFWMNPAAVEGQPA
ncbi:VOC family protein [Loktanella sp. DJP18]|uniref:VOC family protein n=1 Tax=Loktanella sp. DJP18 TaxID=3409788 RepID=UPI003BB71563